MIPEHRLRQGVGKQDLTHTESRGEVDISGERGEIQAGNGSAGDLGKALNREF